MKRNVKAVAKSKVITKKTVFRRGPILIIYDPDATGPEDTLDPEGGEPELKGWPLDTVLNRVVIESGQDVGLVHGSIEFNNSVESFFKTLGGTFNKVGENNINEAERILLEELKPFMPEFSSYLRILEERIIAAREWEELEN